MALGLSSMACSAVVPGVAELAADAVAAVLNKAPPGAQLVILSILFCNACAFA